MKNKLFIIGNGFDLAHGLPTAFDPNFKAIAERNEVVRNFWELYQSKEPSIWADFENCLGRPDYNSLFEIFEGYSPDYYSDHESDRDAIITQADISGNLNKSLVMFAQNADSKISNINQLDSYKKLLGKEDYYITFNYTHTLEKIYNVCNDNILHVHGEIGETKLLLGYPQGNYEPVKNRYDATKRGRYIEITVEEFLDREEDYYKMSAYENLINKCKSFYKTFQKGKMDAFFLNKKINEINVIGHSCKIDFDYFEYLKKLYPNANWVFNPYSDEDEDNVNELIKRVSINNFKINK